MNQSLSAKVRIEWVDIYKALAILLVVVGHTTGQFNEWIYFFHVPAFFLISGYTSHSERKSWGRLILVRAYQLLVPLVVLLAVFAVLSKILYSAGLYPIWFSNEYPGLLNTFRAFVKRGDVLVPWLGAAWFLPCLYGVQLVARLLTGIAAEKEKTDARIALAVSALLLVVVYLLTEQGIRLRLSIFSVNLILLFQFYYVLGWLLERTKFVQRLYQACAWKKAIVLLGCAAIFFVLKTAGLRATDYVSLNWEALPHSVLGALTGCLLLAVLSMLAEALAAPVKRALIYCGRNTLAVLLLHFAAYKIPVALLVVLGVCPAAALAGLTPPSEISRWMWPVLTFVVIVISLIAWKALTVFRAGRILLGADREAAESIGTFSEFRWFREKVPGVRLGIRTSVRNVREKLGLPGVTLLAAGLAAVYAVWPTLLQGITLNDELQTRFDRQQGLLHGVLHQIQIAVQKGRVLSIPFDWRYLGFLTDDMFWNKVICAAMILLNVILLARMLYRLKKDMLFVGLTGFLLIVCMPITFEHTPPSAFTPLVALPMMWLQISLLCFLNILERKGTYRWQATASAVCFVIAMSEYEFILMYCFLYPLLYWYVRVRDREAHSFFQAFRTCLPQVAACAVYLALYVGTRILFPSNYEGNQLTFVSLSNSFQIIKTLLLSALPGYYCWNGKYRYLMDLYGDGLMQPGWWKNLGLLLFLIAVAVVIFHAVQRKTQDSPRALRGIGLLTLLLYLVLPSIPNSLSALYQGSVSDSFFTSLPVSYFLYFTASILFAAVVLRFRDVLRRFVKPVGAAVVVTVLVLAVAVPQQQLNHVVAREQASDYERLVMIEDFFETGSAKELQDKKVYAPDLYEAQNLLAIHSGFWEAYAAREGISTTFITDPALKDEADASIEIRDGMVLLWLYDDQVLRVLTKNPLSGTETFVTPDHYAHEVTMGNPGSDSVFYFYGLYWNTDDNSLTQFT